MKPLIRSVTEKIKKGESVDFPDIFSEKGLVPLWIPPSDRTKMKELEKAVTTLFKAKKTERTTLIHLSLPRKPLWATRKAYIQEMENREEKDLPHEEYQNEWMEGFEKMLLQSLKITFYSKLKDIFVDCFTDDHKEKVGKISDKVKKYMKRQLNNGNYIFKRKIPGKVIEEISCNIKKIFFFSVLAKIEGNKELEENLDLFLILLKEAFIPLGWNEEQTFIFINLLK